MLKILTINMVKLPSVKKSTQKLSSHKEIVSQTIWDFSVIRKSKKHVLTCPGLYRLIFSVFISG